MQYMLMFYETAEEMAKANDPVASGPYWAAWMAYVGAVQQSGVMVSGNGLHGPQTATTVRMQDGKRQIQDGPFADSKEQLGGYFIIEVDSLDEALNWAARSPNASAGGTEIRPVMPDPQ